MGLWICTVLTTHLYAQNNTIQATKQDTHKTTSPTKTAKTASLESIIARALTNSVQADLIKASSDLAKSGTIKAQAPLDVHFDSSLQLTHAIPDNLSGDRPLTPAPAVDSTQQAQWKNTVSKGFVTGTRVALDVTAGVRDSTFEKQTDLKPTYNTDLTLSVSQNLIKNHLGTSWQLAQNIAFGAIEAEKMAMQVKLQKLVVSIVKQFFALKKLQTEYISTVAKHKKSEDILSKARMLFQRGNLEEANLYQIDIRVKIFNDLKKHTHLSLTNTWDNIVEQLSLDESYLSMDPSSIQLSYVNQRHNYLKTCNTPILWDNIAEYQQLKKQYQNHSEQIQLLKENEKPSLDAGVSFNLSNKEDNFTDSLTDSLSAQHSTLSFNLTYKQSLSNHVIKADLWQKTQQSTISHLTLKSFQSQRESAIRNSCRKIQHLRLKEKSLAVIYAQQQKRASLEQARFNIGKQDYFKATEGSIDAIDAKYRLDMLKYDLEQEIWQLHYLSGELKQTSYENKVFKP